MGENSHVLQDAFGRTEVNHFTESDWRDESRTELLVYAVNLPDHIPLSGRLGAETHSSRLCYRAAFLESAPLIYDSFGNPFRPVACSPSLRTDTTMSLARGLYESREFRAMPILADALQDAGCDNDEILNHCRDANATHVRGCWVLDLVLEKA